ncbi:hypothetical protein Tco_1535465 [Tanacetum coccineum]
MECCQKVFMNTRIMRNLTVIHTSVDDQFDFDIIFDNPYVEDNSGQDEHDSNAHDQSYADIESLIYNVLVEAKNQCKMNNELTKQKVLLQKELETCKERVKDVEKKYDQFQITKKHMRNYKMK